ncbi:glycerol-3-phosphate acyltransferase [Bacillus sp. EB106-08-02-XG196]|uniref:glycerol-3-phosphate acyltransferase n=1 Tax=Bacillus sp. EB106-08-02-XG196 TaxID=2737049 RepID=UPI0015C4CCD9|nr:glycerol-3-phosphate acyltransferase [Bacillus sp. EB106-08-02-XG196]NWQ39524.1 glycerol-3-phosphate acyltransferase [Bacillus sp. EB106-08-02-XG196]
MIWLYFILSYFIGSIMFGFLITKIIYRKDIRVQGSGNVGARNAGRLHGKTAFVLIFLGDALKGVLVILAARYMQFSESIQLIGLALAILGHIKPITLKFKGGKGISTFIGGIIAFEPLLVPVIILGFCVLYPFMKSFTLAGLATFLFIPVVLFIKNNDWLSCIVALGIIGMLYAAHAENLKERLKPNE